MACTVFLLALSACQMPTAPTDLPPSQNTATAFSTATVQSTVTVQSTATQQATAAVQDTATAQPTQTPAGAAGELSMDLSGIAQGMTIETVAAVPTSQDIPWWSAAPEYRLVTLQGYPVADHLMKAQIFIYPAEELAKANENAGQVSADLQTVLQSQQPGNVMPFLPLYNAAQVMHAQVQYLNFQNGSGVRYLTQFDQAILPINNYELIYTFQGLSSDGKYYIAAVLPINHPELPATQQVSEQQISEMNDFPAYLAKTVAWLEEQPGNSFTPDLAKLDALIQSIVVK